MRRITPRFWISAVGLGLALAPGLASAGTIQMTGLTKTLDPTSAGEETFLHRQGDRLMLTSNYSGGENNADRYGKVFVSDPTVEFWAAAHKWIQANPGSVFRSGAWIYFIVTAGADHETTEIWRTPASGELAIERVMDTEVSFGNLVATQFNQRLHVYGIADDGELKAWKRKDGAMIDSPFRAPFDADDAVQLQRALVFDGRVLLFAVVNNRPMLLQSADGKTFVEVATFPFNKQTDVVTAIEAGHGRLLVGATRDDAAVVFRTPNLATWNRIYRKEWTDSSSFEIDFLRQGRNRVQLLRYEQTTADPGHPTVALLARRDGDWNRREVWENTHRGNGLVRLNGTFYASLNHGDGPTIARVE
jgi:hypothetical protein